MCLKLLGDSVSWGSLIGVAYYLDIKLLQGLHWGQTPHLIVPSQEGMEYLCSWETMKNHMEDEMDIEVMQGFLRA